MTIPTTNIGLSHVQTEFGGSNPISLSEYYAGGTYVPTGQKNNSNVSVPTSGTISIGNFTGATKLVSLGATLPNPIDCISFLSGGPTLTLSNAGTWTGTGAGSGTWLTGGGTNADYEARASNLTGNTGNATGTYNTWLVLSTSRTWGLVAGAIGTLRTTSFTLEIRMAASPNTVLATATVNMEADRT
jgi:hypothetical protein